MIENKNKQVYLLNAIEKNPLQFITKIYAQIDPICRLFQLVKISLHQSVTKFSSTSTFISWTLSLFWGRKKVIIKKISSKLNL